MFEPSAWLRQRLAHIVSQTAEQAPVPPSVLVVPLGLVEPVPGTVEDRTCDRCQRFLPQSEDMKHFLHRPEPWLIVVGGFCAPCAEGEVPR